MKLTKFGSSCEKFDVWPRPYLFTVVKTYYVLFGRKGEFTSEYMKSRAKDDIVEFMLL